jgi:hypothetical protein
MTVRANLPEIGMASVYSRGSSCFGFVVPVPAF